MSFLIVYEVTGPCTLIVAKLDRLTRDVGLLQQLRGDGRLRVRFADLPDLGGGPMDEFLLMIMASVAQLEARLIGQRTKAASAARKARGHAHGFASPKVTHGERARAAANQAYWRRHGGARAELIAAAGRAIEAEVNPAGRFAWQAVARNLTRQDYRAPRGGELSGAQLRRMVLAERGG